MRVNVYAEEMSEDIQIIRKKTDDGVFTGLRIYLYLPVTVADPNTGVISHVQGKFMHHPGDDDSAAITFWGKKDLRKVLSRALDELDAHYAAYPPAE